MLGVLGIFIAYTLWVKRPGTSARIQARFGALHGFFAHKWYFDEAYDLLVVRPFAWTGRFANSTIERGLVDGVLVGGTRRRSAPPRPRCAACRPATCATTPRCCWSASPDSAPTS